MSLARPNATPSSSPAGPRLGATERLSARPDRLGRIAADLAGLGLEDLRLTLAPAGWSSPERAAEVAALVLRAGEGCRLVPVLVCPAEEGTVPLTLAAAVEALADLAEEAFDWIELDASAVAPEPGRYSASLGPAVLAARARGKRVAITVAASRWAKGLEALGQADLLEALDAVGFGGSPAPSAPWADLVAGVRAELERAGADAQVWLAGVGLSSRGHGEYEQLRELARVAGAGADRAYWHALRDPEAGDTQADEPHLGLARADGQPKLPARLWAAEGFDGVRALAGLKTGRPPRRDRPVLITGGCGFVGTNLADRLLRSGRRVLVYDNLSRPGVEKNLRWLAERHGDRLEVEVADVRRADLLGPCVARAAQVFHFAAQVAVTTSLADPREDFGVNVGGTLNLLEALRQQSTPPPIVFTSTNKVYGALDDVALRPKRGRYDPSDAALRRLGVAESRPLDFHSPYGCSKGAADQYVLDYARTFGVRGVVFRMSCIYGPHQFGTEDQGWVAHFLIKALCREPITIYGDGMQVRDLLFVEDLVDAFLLAQEHMDAISGQAFNIGGGPANATSLLELLDHIDDLRGEKPEVSWSGWRPGDQRYYVSDTRKFRNATGWCPEVPVRQGIARLLSWLEEGRAPAARGRRAARRPPAPGLGAPLPLAAPAAGAEVGAP